jgi:ribosomal protein S27E
MTNFVPMTRYSRCKRYSGALIKCPECNSIQTIYHLSWSFLYCQNCKNTIEKFDWFIEKGKHSKL